MDRSAAFAERSRGVLTDNLVGCEERFPLEGAHSLILVVVERDAGSVREKLKMAKLLIAGDMKEEAREPLLEAIWLRGCMFAIDNRVPEPKNPSSAVDSCLGPYWEEHFIVAKQFVEDSSQAPDGVIEVLGICRG